MSMTRDEFKRAFTEVVSMEFADIPPQESEIDFTFSKEFTRKMNNLIAMQEDGVWKLVGMVRRHIAIIAIIILGVTVSACGINHVITHLYGNVYEEMREEFYAGVTETEIAYEYRISELPEGFEVTSVTKNNGHKMTECHDGKGNEIRFLQDATEGVNLHIKVDIIEKTSITIRDLEVVVFENAEVMGAMWIEDGYFMEVLYDGCEDVEEVIKLVESIQ